MMCKEKVTEVAAGIRICLQKKINIIIKLSQKKDGDVFAGLYYIVLDR